MHSDIFELCDVARTRIAVPPFPRAVIRAEAQHAPTHSTRKPAFVTAIAAGLSLVAIAAAAQIITQSHIRLTPLGGLVISSTAKMASRPIHSEAEIREAAQRVNFPVILPVGLPEGTKPVRLFTAGKDMLAVTYNLPGGWRASHHQLWIFLVNPATIGAYRAPLDRYRLRAGGRMSQVLMWRAGGEQVIAVSNGSTPAEMKHIQTAMQQKAR